MRADDPGRELLQAGTDGKSAGKAKGYVHPNVVGR